MTLVGPTFSAIIAVLLAAPFGVRRELSDTLFPNRSADRRIWHQESFGDMAEFLPERKGHRLGPVKRCSNGRPVLSSGAATDTRSRRRQHLHLRDRGRQNFGRHQPPDGRSEVNATQLCTVAADTRYGTPCSARPGARCRRGPTKAGASSPRNDEEAHSHDVRCRKC